MNIPLNPHDLLFLLAPGLIAMIIRPDWSSNAKFLVALAVSFAAALTEVLLTGQMNLDFSSQARAASLGLALVKAFGLTMTAYAGGWKIFLPAQLKFLETQVNVVPGAGE